MGAKNIAISDEAYQRLKALRKPGESFTHAIIRMTGHRGILELAGSFNEEEAEELREDIRKLRKRSSRRLNRVIAKTR